MKFVENYTEEEIESLVKHMVLDDSNEKVGDKVNWSDIIENGEEYSSKWDEFNDMLKNPKLTEEHMKRIESQIKDEDAKFPPVFREDYVAQKPGEN